MEVRVGDTMTRNRDDVLFSGSGLRPRGMKDWEVYGWRSRILHLNTFLNSPDSLRGAHTNMLMLKLEALPLGHGAEVKGETLRCF